MMAGRSTLYEPLDIDEGGHGVHHRRPQRLPSVFLAPRTRNDWIFVAANGGLFLITVLLWLSGSKSLPSELECAKTTSAYCEFMASFRNRTRHGHDFIGYHSNSFL